MKRKRNKSNNKRNWKNYLIPIVLSILFLGIAGVFASSYISNEYGSLNLNGQDRFTISNYTFLNNNISWNNLNSYPVACPAGTYLTELNDSVTCSAISGNISIDNMFFGNTNGTHNETSSNRPFVSNYPRNISVCSSGCDYTRIQDAINQVPLILRHEYLIDIHDGVYNENLYIPPIISSGVLNDGIYNQGSCVMLKIWGNQSDRNAVSIQSAQISGANGCQTPSLAYMRVLGTDPLSSENVSIAVYGSNHVVLQRLNFTGNSANIGIMSYGSSLTISTTDFGNNDLDYAMIVKHGGEIYFNDGANYGSVTNHVVYHDSGNVYFNNDTISSGSTKSYYSSDSSGIETSKNNLLNRQILDTINYFSQPINPATQVVPTKNILVYYKADTLNDYSGNGFNLTVFGNSRLIDSKFGLGFEGNGSGERFYASNTTIPNNLNEVSWFGWAKLNTLTPASQTIFRTGGTGLGSLGILITNSGTKMSCVIQLNSTIYQTSDALDLDPTINWNHYGCVYNGTDINYYLNGNKILSLNVIEDYTVTNLSSNFFTINDRWGGGNPLNGTSDEIIVFNKSFNDEAVKDLYEKNSNLFLPESYYLKGKDINPITNAIYNIGSSIFRWLKGWFVDLDVSGKIYLNNTNEYFIYFNGSCIVANGTGQTGACL